VDVTDYIGKDVLDELVAAVHTPVQKKKVPASILGARRG
jgi:hypothetical protein